MQVKIINADNVFKLEEKINAYIRDREDIVDIKYQGEGNHPAYSDARVSAMIIMR